MWSLSASSPFVLSVGHAAYNEYVNIMVRRSWAYADAMPKLLGIGLSPLPQWVIVPAAAIAWAAWRTALE